MGSANAKLKRGMKGSNGGRGRWEYTEVLKSNSKKARRTQGKDEIEESLDDMYIQRQHLAEVNASIGELAKEFEEVQDKIVQLLKVRDTISKEISNEEAKK